MLEDEVQFDGFFIDDEEVGYLDQRGERQEVIPVCSLLRATAITRNTDGNDWGKLFSLKDPAGEEKHYHMRNAMLAASPSAIISDLVDKGLRVGPHPKSRGLLIRYLGSAPTNRSLWSSAKPGWVNGSFVLPDGYFCSEEIIYSGGYHDHGVGVAGDWKNNIGKFCSGNTRLILAASTAFAAPLLSVVEMEGGGFHFRGQSSVGKSTALEVAASIYGSAGKYLVNWDTTKNALEEVSEAHNDCLMVIDELGLVDGSIVGFWRC